MADVAELSRQAMARVLITDEERAAAETLIETVAESIDRHLTPHAQALLAKRGITIQEAIEFLARRALEAVIESAQAEEPA